jgi:Raf kinase inhibitor-like YbhB/YbcL family protein
VTRHLVTRSAALVAVVVLTATACDTGDGKTLMPYDPADYPAATTTTVADSVDTTISSQFGDLGGADAGLVDGSDPGVVVGTEEPFTMTAPWVDGDAIDGRYGCDGLDVSPSLAWGGVPEGTVEIAIVMVDDSSIVNGQPFVHWVIAGLDPDEIALVEGDVPEGAVQALNFFGDVGYGGPCPSPGDDAHVYRFTAYALNSPLQVADGSPATEFLSAIAPVTIRSTDLTGTFQR